MHFEELKKLGRRKRIEQSATEELESLKGSLRYWTDTCKGFKYILADSAYDFNRFYGYIFEKTGLIPVIDTNKKRGLDTEKQKQLR
jgi:hypothetical protein